MSTLAMVGWGVAVVFVLMVLLNRRAVGNLIKATAAQVGKIGRAAKNADPVANMQELVDSGYEKIQKAKGGLAGAGADVRRYQRAVETGEAEQTRLSERIQAAMDAGNPNGTASGYAIELASVEEQLADDRKSLEDANASFQTETDNLRLAQTQLEDAKKRLKKLGLKLERSEREKELDKFSNDFDPNAFMSEIAEHEEAINNKIDQNMGAVDVNRKMNQEKFKRLKDDELVKKTKANDVLARFKKKEPQ